MRLHLTISSSSVHHQHNLKIFFVKRSQYWKRGRPTINFSDYSLTMTRLTLLTKLIHLFYNRKTDQSNDNHERIVNLWIIISYLLKPTTSNMKHFFPKIVSWLNGKLIEKFRVHQMECSKIVEHDEGDDYYFNFAICMSGVRCLFLFWCGIGRKS